MSTGPLSLNGPVTTCPLESCTDPSLSSTKLCGSRCSFIDLMSSILAIVLTCLLVALCRYENRLVTGSSACTFHPLESKNIQFTTRTPWWQCSSSMSATWLCFLGPKVHPHQRMQ